jgi:hypothetical protein
MAEGLSPLPLFQPFLRVRKPVRKQRNTAQPEDSRISLGILVGYSHVDFTSFGKLPNLEPPIRNSSARKHSRGGLLKRLSALGLHRGHRANEGLLDFI